MFTFVINAFIHSHIEPFEQKAVSWDAAPCLKDDDISDYKVIDVHGLSCSVLAADDSNIFVLN